MSKEIPLTQGKVAIVDDEDYEWLMQYKWHAKQASGKRTYYASRTLYLGPHKYRPLAMHTVIMNPAEGLQIDHINSNGLDNRKCNLRPVTVAQNLYNQRKPLNYGISQYKGVHWYKKWGTGKNTKGRWVARLQYQGKKVYIGHFDSEIKAAKAYNQKAQELFGEFARLNVIKE